jgi:hypothetical protein
MGHFATEKFVPLCLNLLPANIRAGVHKINSLQEKGKQLAPK